LHCGFARGVSEMLVYISTFEFVFIHCGLKNYTLIRCRWLKNKPKRPRKQFHVILSNILNEVYALTASIYALIDPINLS